MSGITPMSMNGKTDTAMCRLVCAGLMSIQSTLRDNYLSKLLSPHVMHMV